MEQPECDLIRQDLDRLLQILTNLISNSVKYSISGTIEIKAKCVENGFSN
jgi:signal transduction histidine kinase